MDVTRSNRKHTYYIQFNDAEYRALLRLIDAYRIPMVQVVAMVISRGLDSALASMTRMLGGNGDGDDEGVKV